MTLRSLDLLNDAVALECLDPPELLPAMRYFGIVITGPQTCKLSPR